MPSVDESVDGRSIIRGHALHQSILIENDGDGNPLYVGWAAPGSASSLPVWRICLITGGANPTAVQWAQGNISYAYVWDDRATYTYT